MFSPHIFVSCIYAVAKIVLWYRMCKLALFCKVKGNDTVYAFRIFDCVHTECRNFRISALFLAIICSEIAEKGVPL